MVSEVKSQTQERKEIPLHSAPEVDSDFIRRVEHGRLVSEALCEGQFLGIAGGSNAVELKPGGNVRFKLEHRDRAVDDEVGVQPLGPDAIAGGIRRRCTQVGHADVVAADAVGELDSGNSPRRVFAAKRNFPSVGVVRLELVSVDRKKFVVEQVRSARLSEDPDSLGADRVREEQQSGKQTSEPDESELDHTGKPPCGRKFRRKEKVESKGRGIATLIFVGLLTAIESKFFDPPQDLFQ